MSVRYRTEYSNEVHQLVVSVSRHLWIGKDGAIRHQVKPFEISLAKLATSAKRHIVHYLVRDHHSGAFYAEIATSPNLPDVRKFLLRAWSRKDHLSFCGVPEFLTVPQTVDAQFPDLLTWLDDLGVEIVEATSGFQAGVRDLKTWEDDFRYNLAWYPADDLDRLPALSESMCYDLTERELFNRPHVNRWRAGLRNLRFPLPDNPVIQIASEEWRRHIRDLELERLNRIAARVEARHTEA
ncbi:MAG TPA: hypothetical protein VEK11_01485 [Thermoanaerobaculia bacterium]|nr:hypothetical protein [Thermoanaerobaculia bacterium]